MQEELHRLSEDLESCTRENEAITASLASCGEERERWHAEARACAARLSHAERVLAGQNAEISDLRSACEVSTSMLAYACWCLSDEGMLLPAT